MPDHLLATAYVDGELAAEARQRFESRLAEDPALGREVASIRAICDLIARHHPFRGPEHPTL